MMNAKSTRARLARRNWIFSVIAALFALSLPGQARAEEPQTIVQRMVDNAFEVLRDPALQQKRSERLTRLRAIADRGFDWEEMAQSSLGVSWRKLTEPQRREFVSVFKDVLADQYMDDIDRFRGTERVVMNGTTSIDSSRLVKTILITSSRERIPIDYLMQPTGGAYRVVDVRIEGVSLVNHYRKSFSRFLVNESFDELIRRLRARLVR